MAKKFTPQSGESSPAEIQKEQNKHEITIKTLTIVYTILLAIVIGSFLMMGIILFNNGDTNKEYIHLFITLMSSIVTGTIGLVAGHKLQKD